VPEGADLSLGCGAPVDHLELQPGETVLDLGSGGGLDVFLAAKQVGPTGHVIGVDMTPAMLERARQNAARSGHSNVDFREGRLEALPVDDASVDAVTSNCVINLVPDKGAVFREVARVLRTGGRLVISDVILDGRLPEALERDVLAYVGCVSGAMQREAYFALLREAGLGEIELIKDVDFLAVVADSVPEEVKAFVETSGVEVGELAGKVHSVTFRARKS
jgi:SAM-dependent methyltransferase